MKFTDEFVGKKVPTSKRRIEWVIGVGLDDVKKHDHTIVLKHSVRTSKKEILLDDRVS